MRVSAPTTKTMTDRNDRPPKGTRGQIAKRLKLKMPWDDWLDLSSEERAQKESASLDYRETALSPSTG